MALQPQANQHDNINFLIGKNSTQLLSNTTINQKAFLTYTASHQTAVKYVNDAMKSKKINKYKGSNLLESN